MHLVQNSRFFSLPVELQERVVTTLTLDAGLASLVPLLCTCKRINEALSPRRNPHLATALFRARFDASAAIRRFGDHVINTHGFASQLTHYCTALRAIRHGDVRAHDTLHTLRTAFTMLMEDDGRNRVILEAAGLPDFVDRFVRERLQDDSVHGWPAESEINSLALWLLWLTTTEDRLRAESPAHRSQIIKTILPFVLMPVRYPSALAPYLHFTVPISSEPSDAPHSVPTVHGEYPRYHRMPSAKVHHYNLRSLDVGVPLASVAAKLVYFSRREVSPIQVPSQLPRTREHAFQLGLTMVGPTQEDVHELNTYKVAKLPSTAHTDTDWWTGMEDASSKERAKRAPSARWDEDWNRLLDCNDLFKQVSLKRVHYVPGTLAGLWQGRILQSDNVEVERLLLNPHMPPDFSEQLLGTAGAPVFMRLREYHCMDVHSNEPVPAGKPDDLVYNAWFPGSMVYKEVENGLSISYTTTSPTSSPASNGARPRATTKTHHYHLFDPTGPSLHDESKCRGCIDRGTSDMVYREDDAIILADRLLAAAPLPDYAMDEDIDADEGDGDGDDRMSVDGDQEELVMEGKCNGIMDIVLVGETDARHAQAWNHYRYYGRVREWDGLVAIVSVRACVLVPSSPYLGPRVFTGYVVGGQTLVGNWRTTSHPNEPVSFEGAFVMSKREE
ncbi:hypothetical protein ID866_4077 [Astraeus odoratus]|nr:hypothetical protein ID866_4077 [Astraeus odoratus]